MEVRGRPAANRAAPVQEVRALAEGRDPADPGPAVEVPGGQVQAVQVPAAAVPVAPAPVVEVAAAIHRNWNCG